MSTVPQPAAPEAVAPAPEAALPPEGAPPQATPAPAEPQTPPSTTPDPARLQLQVEGLQKIADPMLRAGYKDPERVTQALGRLDRYGDVIDAMEKGGLDPTQALARLTTATPDPQQPAPTQPAPQTPVDLSQLTNDLSNMLIRRDAMTKHETEFSAQERAIDGTVAELQKIVDDTDAISAFMDQEIRSIEGRLLYPNGHPLRDESLRPMTEAEIKQVGAKVAAKLRKLVGEQTRQAADDALSTAGNATPSLTTTGDTAGDKPFFAQSNEVKEAHVKRVLEQVQARTMPRTPQPMSRT